MRPMERVVREGVVLEALRAADMAIGKERPTDQAIRIIAALKLLRDDAARQVIAHRVDYLDRVQKAAHRAWMDAHGDREAVTGPEHDAIAGIDTPFGRLKAITFRRPWKGGRIAWATEYYLNDDPITIAEIRAAGLAQRPTSRNRQRRK